MSGSDDSSSAAIAAAFQAATEAWPTVNLDLQAFADGITAMGADAQSLAARPADLFLAIACRAKLPRANAAFTASFTPLVDRALSRYRLSPAVLADVRQTALMRMLVGPSPRITTYQGKGPLGAWVRIVAVRTALDHLAETRTMQERSERLDDAPVAHQDPELAVLRRQLRGPLVDALAATLARLQARDKTILRLHVMDGLSPTAIAAVLGVHRATALRALARINASILKDLRGSLGRQLGMTTADLRGLATVYTADLHLSLSRLLPARAAE